MTSRVDLWCELEGLLCLVGGHNFSLGRLSLGSRPSTQAESPVGHRGQGQNLVVR